MTPTERVVFNRQELDAIAWRFLESEYTGQHYSEWPIDRRVDAYLLHDGPVEVLNDGSVYAALLERIMANIRPAMLRGVLTPPNV